MRLALVTQEYPPDTARGGIGTQSHLKAHGLAARGHEVHVVSHGALAVPETCCDGPVQVHRIPGPDHRLPVRNDPTRWLLYSARVAEFLAELESRVPLDLVEFPEFGGEA
ncbi:MAG: glycosyltransferase [Candidatus Latescibacterota bacterium]